MNQICDELLDLNYNEFVEKFTRVRFYSVYHIFMHANNKDVILSFYLLKLFWLFIDKKKYGFLV